MIRQTSRWGVALVVAQLLCGTTSPASAADATLVRLESAVGNEVRRDKILARSGLQAAVATPARPTWKLLPGDHLGGTNRPDERVIELYTGTPQSPILLCHVLLRYYRDHAGWAPHFQLRQEPLIALMNGKWQPLELAPGMDAVVVQHGATLPNPEGFSATLELGLRNGPLQLVGWKIRTP
jgi:hypothetical protein